MSTSTRNYGASNRNIGSGPINIIAINQPELVGIDQSRKHLRVY